MRAAKMLALFDGLAVHANGVRFVRRERNEKPCGVQ